MRRILTWIIILGAVVAAIWWLWIRPQESTVMVYFIGPAAGGGTIVPVERVVKGRGDETILRGAFEELVLGPSAEERARGLSTEIPAGTRVRGLTVREGTATIDLSEAVTSGGGSASMQARLWQIVYTGTQRPSARQVRLLIEGTERQALGGEGVLIDRPIGRPPVFPRF